MVDLGLGSENEELQDRLFGMTWRMTMAEGQEPVFESLDEVAAFLNIQDDEHPWNVSNG